MIALLAAIALAEPPDARSVHAEHRALALGAWDAGFVRPRPRPLPTPTDGPHARVYGYMPFWSGELETMPWDELSDLALFSADVDTGGNLLRTNRWGDVELAVQMAEPYGVRVHLCVTNFDTGELATLLGSASARANLIDQLEEWVDATGAHGVNIDFENLPASRRNEMVQFIVDLEAAVGEVVIATPSVDWSDAWDYAALTDHADLFIMGYGYHWSGSDNAGPVDPLYAGDIWAPWTLQWSVEDYLAAGADPQRVILGLPLYGYAWPTANDDVPAASLGNGTSVVWSVAQAEAAAHGRNWEIESHTPWYFDGTKQTWYSDVQGVTERTIYAVEVEQLGGIGFWALGYDNEDAALWDAVRQQTHFDTSDDPDDPPVSDAFTARTNRPFLAYPGDIAVLSGASSEGPGGLSLRYEWTQVAGPRVDLVLVEPMRPQFLVEEPGTHVFELRVGDGTRWSAPASAYVTVLDPAAGRRHHGCGCDAAPQGGWLALPLIGLLLRRRVRPHRTHRE